MLQLRRSLDEVHPRPAGTGPRPDDRPLSRPVLPRGNRQRGSRPVGTRRDATVSLRSLISIARGSTPRRRTRFTTYSVRLLMRSFQWCHMSSPGHDELRRWREQGRAPAGSCPFCASRICVIERDGVFVARCSHRGCGARGPRHHDLTRACDLFCCPPQRTAGGMGGPDVGGAL